MREKGFALPLVLVVLTLVVIVVGVIVYFQFKTQSTKPTQTPPTQSIPQPTDETADWKTYRNEKYGFEFKYPQKYKIDEDLIFTSWGHLGSSCDKLIQCEKNLVFNEIQYKESDLAFIEYTKDGKKSYAILFIQKNTPLGDGIGRIEFVPPDESLSSSDFKNFATKILSTFKFLD